MKESKGVSVAFPEDRKKQLMEYCKETGQGVASFIRRIVYEALDAK